MKKIILMGTFSAVATGAVLGSACLATGNCRSRVDVTPASHAVALAQKPAKAAARKIRWHTSLESALKESKRTGKPVFADFYADWCPPCRMLEAQTYPDPKVIAESQKWVMLKVDTEKHTDLAVKYGIASLPTLAILRSDGKPVNGTTGFLNANDFVQFLRDMEREFGKK